MEIEVLDHVADDGMYSAEGASAANARRTVYNNRSASIDLTDKLNQTKESSRRRRQPMIWPFSVLEMRHHSRRLFAQRVGHRKRPNHWLCRLIDVHRINSNLVVHHRFRFWPVLHTFDLNHLAFVRNPSLPLSSATLQHESTKKHRGGTRNVLLRTRSLVSALQSLDSPVPMPFAKNH